MATLRRLAASGLAGEVLAAVGVSSRGAAFARTAASSAFRPRAPWTRAPTNTRSSPTRLLHVGTRAHQPVVKATAAPLTARGALETLGVRTPWRPGALASPTSGVATRRVSHHFKWRKQVPRRPSPGVAGALVPSARRHLWTNSRVPPGGSGAGGTIGSLIRAARKFGAALALPFVLLWKYKFAALSALKLTKLSSLASLALSTAAYAALYGVPYGVGIMAQIVIHESGHAIALMRYGVPFQPMVFVPLMGAYVSHAGMLSAWKNAFVALAGPFAGGVGALGLYLMGVALTESEGGETASSRERRLGRTPNVRDRARNRVRERGAEKTTAQLCHALADFGCMINLFNLLPMGMLDGGQVAAVLHPSLLVAGCAVGSYMAYDGQINNPIVYLIILGGWYQVASRAMGWSQPNPAAAHLSPRGKAIVFGAYAGLAASLAVLMQMNQARLYGPRGEPPGSMMREESEYSKEFDRIVASLPDI